MKKNKKIILGVVIGLVVLALIIGLGYFLYVQSTYLSKNEVKRIVLEDTGLSDEEVTFQEIDLDLDGITKKYDVEFYYNNIEYQYEIDAKNGKVITSDFIKDSSVNNTNNTTSDTNNESSEITLESAQKIALEDAKLSRNDVIFQDMDLEKNASTTYYEIDFLTNTLEYEYQIDAKSGAILHKEQEVRD